MQIDTKKLELIDWITKLKDPNVLERMLLLKKKWARKKKNGYQRSFGSGKQLVEFIADDFNEPLDAFKEYQS